MTTGDEEIKPLSPWKIPAPKPPAVNQLLRFRFDGGRFVRGFPLAELSALAVIDRVLRWWAEATGADWQHDDGLSAVVLNNCGELTIERLGDSADDGLQRAAEELLQALVGDDALLEQRGEEAKPLVKMLELLQEDDEVLFVQSREAAFRAIPRDRARWVSERLRHLPSPPRDRKVRTILGKVVSCSDRKDGSHEIIVNINESGDRRRYRVAFDPELRSYAAEAYRFNEQCLLRLRGEFATRGPVTHVARAVGSIVGGPPISDLLQLHQRGEEVPHRTTARTNFVWRVLAEAGVNRPSRVGSVVGGIVLGWDTTELEIVSTRHLRVVRRAEGVEVGGGPDVNETAAWLRDRLGRSTQW